MKAKKILAGVLTCAMVFAMGMTAFAEDSAPTDQSKATIKKEYKLKGEGTSPEETFTLMQVGDGVVKDGEATSAPALGTIEGATFEEGAATVEGTTGDITVALPEYTNVGVYEYTLKEVAGSTAGVTYYGENIRLVVTVVNGENGNLRIAAVHTEIGDDDAKSDTITNTYTANTLKVSKTVTGNLGDKSKYFEFKVTLTGEDGKTYADSYAVSGGSYEDTPKTIKVGAETTFKLKHGDTISIANLPAGVTYKVVETKAEGYTTTKTGDEGIINGNNASTAAFTNTKTGEVDTGINLTSLPYMLTIAGIVVIAAIAFVAKRRRFED